MSSSRRGDETGETVALAQCLLEGLGRGHEALAVLVGAGPEVEDRELARALVKRLTARSLAEVSVERERRVDPRAGADEEEPSPLDSSFLGQLGSSTRGVFGLDDVRTLVAVMRGGTLDQRRAAVQRLGTRIADGRGIPSDDLKVALDVVATARDEEIGYELAAVRANLPGSVGRKARSEREPWERMSAALAAEVVAFWHDERTDDPIAALPGDQRAALFARARDLPDVVAAHLGAIIEGSDGVTDRSGRLALIAYLRLCGDARLLPSFASVAEGGESDLSVEAARAIARIDDPRSREALRNVLQRTVRIEDRVVLAGALGLRGDARGLPDVRKALVEGDARILALALEAVETCGTVEDAARAEAMLEHEDAAVVGQAVHTLSRIGDGRSLAALDLLLGGTQVSALRADVEDAVQAIRARLELRGEEPARPTLTAPRPVMDTVLVATRDPALIRFAARKDHLIGQFWLLIGARERAIRRFEAAAELRPGWVAPILAIAAAYARQGQLAQALATFRRAVEVDRARVEAQPHAMGTLLRCFLRRAEEVERDGRKDIARGLLEEVTALDLRRAPSVLRFEVRRQHEALRARMGHD